MRVLAWKLEIELLALAGLMFATTVSAETLPIDVELPSECQMESVQPGSWVCNYTARNGRERRLLLDFHKIELDEKGRETLSGLDAETLELVLNNEIRKIDDRREAEMPSGGYAKIRYEFLDDASRPSGFVSCVVSRDEVKFAGSSIRNDRASLHCWAEELRQGILYQMLLSLIEFSDPAQSATPTLGEEFDQIVTSIVRN